MLFRQPLRILPSSASVNLNRANRRTFLTEIVPAILVPPVVFTSLLFSLWTYKCMMMVVFQNKIIYMPGVPLGARDETIAAYSRQCWPIEWREEKVRTVDGKSLSMCVADMEGSNIGTEKAQSKSHTHVVVLYLQGNASSLPPRLPLLSQLLRLIRADASTTTNSWGDTKAAKYTLVALSYRGFWKSQGRPSERGILLDTAATLDWIQQMYGSDEKVKFILWGQSIGAGIATTTAARYLQAQVGRKAIEESKDLVRPKALGLGLSGLILETPFTSVAEMLVALYPQRWLPYRYLRPFLKSSWDSKEALMKIAQLKDGPVVVGSDLRTLIVQAAKDELVPQHHGIELEKLLVSLGLKAQRLEIGGCLHTEILTRADGRKAIANFIKELARTP